jgi:Ser/Thr protein kinase RdoA (MazF antagonist)
MAFFRETISQHLAAYDLGNVQNDTDLPSGACSDNLLVTVDDRKLVVSRVQNDPDYVRDTMAFSQYVADHGLRVPEPIETANGDLVSPIDDETCVLVQTYVPGEIPSKVDSVEAFLPQIGATVGTFHDIGVRAFGDDAIDVRSDDFRTEKAEMVRNLDCPPEPPIDIDAHAEQLTPEGADEPAFRSQADVCDAYERYRERVQEVPYNDLTRGYCWDDPVSEHFHVQDGEITGIVDLKSACQNPLVIDLAWLVWDQNLHREDERDAFRALIAPYLDASPVPERELRYLPWALETHLLGVVNYTAECIEAGDTQGLPEWTTNEEVYLKNLSVLAEVKELPDDYFL